MPQCQFLFIMSVHCRKGRKTIVLRKIPKKYRNSISPEDSVGQKDKSRGGPQPQDDTWARLGGGGTEVSSRRLVHRLAPPFGLYIRPGMKNPNPEGFSQIRPRAPPPPKTLIWGTEVSVPAPWRDGKLPPKPSSSPLLPPMMRRE